MASRDTLEEARELAAHVKNARIIEQPYQQWRKDGPPVDKIQYLVVEVRSCANCGGEIHNIDYGCEPYPCNACRKKAEDEMWAASKIRQAQQAEEIARHEAFDQWEEPTRKR
jgi:hypothetical protein